MLVAYFSRSNHGPDGTDSVSEATNKARNTQTAAMGLARLTGGDLFEIISERDYPVSHTACSEIALQEYEGDAKIWNHLYLIPDMEVLRTDGYPQVSRRV